MRISQELIQRSGTGSRILARTDGLYYSLLIILAASRELNKLLEGNEESVDDDDVNEIYLWSTPPAD